ncbi:AF4/FMR2 family member 1 [Cololabis saira]|uniref:AF4/FMR2 family member 1 n=1 Tax=Cololabis saira TaxID=129043 RepID=UPI002AD31C50|nr:AF4/FMR2 family member 1 [Cololabis saira]
MAAQPSVYNEKKNLLRLQAWEERKEKNSPDKELTPEDNPLFGKPYKTNGRNQLSLRIQRILGPFDIVNNPCSSSIETLPVRSRVSFLQSDQGQSNMDKSTKTPFHNPTSQKGLSTNSYTSQPVSHSVYQQKKSEDFSDLRDYVNQERSAQFPDAKPLPLQHGTDNNIDMDTREIFDRHKPQGFTKFLSGSSSTMDASTLNIKQSRKDGSLPQAKTNTPRCQTFPSLLSSKEPGMVMTEKPTAYVRPMDGQDPMFRARFGGIIGSHMNNDASNGGWKRLQQSGEFTQNDRDCGSREAMCGCVEEPNIPDIESPTISVVGEKRGRGEESCGDSRLGDARSPLSARVDGRAALNSEIFLDCPAATSMTLESRESLFFRSSESHLTFSSSSSKVTRSGCVGSESGSKSSTKKPPQPPEGNSVKPRRDFPAVNLGDWQLGNWMRNGRQNSGNDIQRDALVYERRSQKLPPQHHNSKNCGADPTEKRQPHKSSADPIEKRQTRNSIADSTEKHQPHKSSADSTETHQPHKSSADPIEKRLTRNSSADSTGTRQLHKSSADSTETRQLHKSSADSTETRQPHKSSADSTETRQPHKSSADSTETRQPQKSSADSTETRQPHKSSADSTETRQPHKSSADSTETRQPQKSSADSTGMRQPQKSSADSTETHQPQKSSADPAQLSSHQIELTDRLAMANGCSEIPQDNYCFKLRKTDFPADVSSCSNARKLSKPAAAGCPDRNSKLEKCCLGKRPESIKEVVKERESHKHNKSRPKEKWHLQHEKLKPPKSSHDVPSGSQTHTKTPINRPLLTFDESQFSVQYYITEAKRLKHNADAELEKFSRAFIYMDAAMFFVESGIVLEKDPMTSMSPYSMFAETVELIKFVVRLKNPVDSPASSLENDFLVLCMRAQCILQMAMFRHKQTTAVKYSKTLSYHFDTSTQVPHHPPASSSNITNYLPPSAITSSSSGPGSSHCAGGLGVGQVGTTVAIPQEIQKLAFNYITITMLFLNAHCIWEQAEELTHKGSGLLAELDTLLGPLSLTSSLKSMVRYTRQGVHWLRQEGMTPALCTTVKLPLAAFP